MVMSKVGFTVEDREKGLCVNCLSVTDVISDRFEIWCCSNKCNDQIMERLMRKVREDGVEP